MFEIFLLLLTMQESFTEKTVGKIINSKVILVAKRAQYEGKISLSDKASKNWKILALRSRDTTVYVGQYNRPTMLFSLEALEAGKSYTIVVKVVRLNRNAPALSADDLQIFFFSKKWGGE